MRRLNLALAVRADQSLTSITVRRDSPAKYRDGTAGAVAINRLQLELSDILDSLDKLVMLSRAVIEASMMRAQQALSFDHPGFLPPDHFSQLFTTHGTIMIFFMGMPFLTGLINYVMPL